jgi:cobalt/nickel transport system permease protein
MHIPDHYLSPQTCAVLTAAVVPAWAVSIKKIQTDLPLKKISLMGVGAAFSFLGMMFNIPLPGGTTGHAVGGTLIALLLGPYAACISVSMALLLQALLFGDGGILAFGANCFNMAFVLPFVGYAVACLLAPELRNGVGNTAAGSGSHTDPKTGMLTGASSAGQTRKKLIAAAVGSYAGINAAALCAAIEFGIQPMLFRDAAGNALYCPYGLNISIPGMMIGHLTIFGLAEVIFTVAIYAFVAASAADGSSAFSAAGTFTASSAAAHSAGGASAQQSGTPLPVKILLGALIVLTPLGLIAEGTAWGEWGVDEIAATGAGYTPAGMANGFSFNAILPDYSLEGLPDWTAYILAAVIGTALLLIIFRLAGMLGSKKTGASAA